MKKVPRLFVPFHAFSMAQIKSLALSTSHRLL
jgi:hypothetical protein